MRTTLKDWVSSSPSTDRLREVNYNMSYVMKAIHESKLVVKTFNLSQIVLDDENLYPIEFNYIDKSDDIERDIKDNIYNVAFMFIGLHSNMLDVLRPEFLKENFDQFTSFLPHEDVDYYRRVVQNGDRLYYNDYVDQLRMRQTSHQNVDNGNTNSNSKSNDVVKSKQFVKSTAAGRAYKDLYENTSGLASYLIIPIIFVVIAIVVGLIILFIS